MQILPLGAVCSKARKKARGTLAFFSPFFFLVGFFFLPFSSLAAFLESENEKKTK